MMLKIFSLVRYIPAWFPGAGFQKVAEEGRKLSNDLRSRPYEAAKAQIVGHTLFIRPKSREVNITLRKRGPHTTRLLPSSSMITWERTWPISTSSLFRELLPRCTLVCMSYSSEDAISNYSPLSAGADTVSVSAPRTIGV